jgi:hypothetical protein
MCQVDRVLALWRKTSALEIQLLGKNYGVVFPVLALCDCGFGQKRKSSYGNENNIIPNMMVQFLATP